MRARLTASQRATASVVLLLESFPQNLRTWLEAAPSPAAVQIIVRELLAATSFLSAQGFVHFDAHFENILTDGHSVYLSDFGQALWSGFSLATDESDFLERHRDFDRGYVVTKLLNFPGTLPPSLEGCAPLAALMNDFFRRLRTEARTTPFPSAEVARLCGTLLRC